MGFSTQQPWDRWIDQMTKDSNSLSAEQRQKKSAEIRAKMIKLGMYPDKPRGSEDFEWINFKSALEKLNY
jgi:hypothetical protein